MPDAGPRLALAADECLDERIISGVLRRLPGIDLVRVRDVGLAGADGPSLLDWAAQTGRVLITRDVATMPPFAHQRIAEGLPMRGLIVVKQRLPVGQAIDDILLAVELTDSTYWVDRIEYLPLD